MYVHINGFYYTPPHADIIANSQMCFIIRYYTCVRTKLTSVYRNNLVYSLRVSFFFFFFFLPNIQLNSAAANGAGVRIYVYPYIIMPAWRVRKTGRQFDTMNPRVTIVTI